MCMHVRMCALPQHDSLLTPPLQQRERTPLFISAQNGHTNTVLALLQAGAAVDAKNEVRGALYLYVYAYICVHTYMCMHAYIHICVQMYIHIFKTR